MKKRLLDNWQINGSNLDDFKKELESLSGITHVEKISAENITVLSKSNTVTDPNNVTVFVLKPHNMWETTSEATISLKQGKIGLKKFEKVGAIPLVEEFNNKTKLLLSRDGKPCFTSENLMTTLGMRTGVKGDAAVIPTLERDILLAKRLEQDTEMSLIVRNVGGVEKIFAALSANYTYIPQSFLCTVIDKIIKTSKFGTVDCKQWSITNTLAEIYLEFPDYAEEISTVYEMKDALIPGIYLAKSDVGECSVTVRATWRVNSSIIIQDEMKRKHVGHINVNDLLSDIEETIFDKYTLLPDKLCELMSIDITDPTWMTTMPEKQFVNINEKAVAAAIKEVFNGIGLVDAICKKNEKLIYEALTEEIDGKLCYTAYDIVMMVMQMSSRIVGLPEVYRDSLAKACGKAPYVKINKKKPETKIVLV